MLNFNCILCFFFCFFIAVPFLRTLLLTWKVTKDNNLAIFFNSDFNGFPCLIGTLKILILKESVVIVTFHHSIYFFNIYICLPSILLWPSMTNGYFVGFCLFMDKLINQHQFFLLWFESINIWSNSFQIALDVI